MSETTYELFQEGRARLRRGLTAQATVPLEKAKRREPAKASIREALGIAYFRLAPTEHYAHYALGRCLDRLGREDEANGHYKLASFFRPGSERYRSHLRKTS